MGLAMDSQLLLAPVRHLYRAPAPIEDRFWPKVDKNGAGGCWLWTAGLDRHGYGRLGVARGLPSVRAHRLAYEMLVSPIPEGMQLDHLCRNRACVNPAHLEPVPQRENIRRGEGPSGLNAQKTHCVHGHEFSEDNTRRDKKGNRTCRTCKRAGDREYISRPEVAARKRENTRQWHERKRAS